MNLTLQPRLLQGSLTPPPSKSMAHRLLICAAFSGKEVFLRCGETNDDIVATVSCLQALGANIIQTAAGFSVRPMGQVPEHATLLCRESGATLRFLLPIVGALGVDATFVTEGRLSARPISPLWEEMERMGCKLSRPGENTIRCRARLRAGAYQIPGNVSSQFISGLLLAFPLIDGDCTLQIQGQLASAPYVDMTNEAIQKFRCPLPHVLEVESDWSSGAFWYGANALGSQIHVHGLCPDSLQGDRAITQLLPQLKEFTEISAAHIPDLVPVLAVVAALGQGAVFTDAGRLRLKESDRIESTAEMIRSLGGKAEISADALIIHGTTLKGGTVDSFRDHRIAMAAAIAATVCTEPVTILNAECVSKSYPRFWENYQLLGGQYA